MNKRIWIVLVSVACVFGAANVAALAADEKPAADVEKIVAKAMENYKAGKTAEAINGLQEAISAMQGTLQKGMAAFFPKAPEGWEAGEIESSSMAIGSADNKGGAWTNLTRKYTKKDSKTTAQIQMTNMQQLVEAQKGAAEAYKNPQTIAMMNQNPDVKFATLSRDGWSGYTMVQKSGETMAMAFYGATMLHFQVDKGDEETLNTFLNATDFKGLAGLKAAEQPVK